jgi:hypothetical protein
MKYHQIKLRFLLIAIIISNTSLSQKFIEPWTVLKISDSDSIHLVRTWSSFLKSIQNKDDKGIKNLSLNKVYNNSIGHPLPGLPAKELMPIDLYLDSVINKFDKNDFLVVLSDSGFRLFKIKYPDRMPQNLKLRDGKKLILYSINFENIVPGDDGSKYVNYYTFNFVKQSTKFIFFGSNLVSPH